MCGYDPFYWYDWELERQAKAYQAGYDTYEEYYDATHASEPDDFEDHLIDEHLK